MGSLTDLRKMVQDRKEGDAGIATLKFPVCLAPELVSEYHALESRRDERAAAARKQGALVTDTEDFDAQLEAKAGEIEAHTIQLVFRALPGRQYDDVLVDHPGWQNDRAVMNEMYLTLMQRCYRYTLDPDGDKQELELDEVLSAVNSGVLDAMSDAVIDLNRKTPDFPFSSRS